MQKEEAPEHEKYYRLMNPDWVHYGMQWKLGMNEDPLPLETRRQAGPGGLSFCRFQHLFSWRLPLPDNDLLDDYWLGEVEVPPDTEHWTNGVLHKAPRLVLLKATRLAELDPGLYDELVMLGMRHKMLTLQNVRRKNAKLCEEWVRRSGSIRMVPWGLQTPDLVESGVRGRHDIKEVREDLRTQEVWDLLPDDELRWVPHDMQRRNRCMSAVREDARMFRWVNPALQNEKMCALAASNPRFRWLKWVRPDLQNAEMCLRSVLHDPSTMEHVRSDLLTWKLKSTGVARILNLDRSVVQQRLQQGDELCCTVLEQLLGRRKIDVHTPHGKAIVDLWRDCPDPDDEEEEDVDDEVDEEEEEDED